MLVVDQCEEALAARRDSPEREEFFAGLVDFAARGTPLVVTLRADRLGELSAHPDFARLVENGLYLLGAMTEPDLRAPSRARPPRPGCGSSPGWSTCSCARSRASPAALPLLSHVLRQTWRRREGNTLTVEGYAATGGVREAVAQSAEGSSAS